jgi:hypothetical protein
MDLGSILSSFGGTGSSPGVGNVGDGGTGKSSAVAKTTFGDRTGPTVIAPEKPNQTALYLVAGLAALGLLLWALKD